MANTPILKISGLRNFPNPLSAVPEGSLLEATNTVIDRDGIIQPRRGFKTYGNQMGSSPSTDTAKALFTYKDRILRHFSSTLEFDSDGSGDFDAFSGSYSETETGLRIKSIEQNSNFYFTTSSGIKKISASSASEFSTSSGYITNAGGVKALDINLALNAQTGFLEQESVVAYRVVWGIKDANDNLILGTPSERVVISNPLTPLLIKDFNALLQKLDDVTNSGGINDQNYYSTLKVELNSATSTLRTSLISLATKLDNDTIVTEGANNTASYQRTTVSNLQLIFNNDMSTFLQVGDKIKITTLSSGAGFAEVNDNVVTITSVSTTTINGTPTTNYTGTDGAPVADTGGTVQRLKYTLITQPDALSATPTTAQLESMQTYYDTIVTDLQEEPVGIITSTTPFLTSNSTQSSTVNVTITVPSSVTTAHFYQIYRTAIVTSSGVTTLDSLDPGDEMGLVFESNPTSSEISSGTLTVHDITPEAFRGANLYTNPNSGEGIAQANEVPPLSKDISAFKGSTFYANTQTKHRLTLNLLGVASFVSGTSKFTITDGTTTHTYTFVDGSAEVTAIGMNGKTGGTITQSSYFYLNSANDITEYYIWINVSSGGADPAISGKTGLELALDGTETSAQLATKLGAVINSVNDFSVSVLSTTVTVTNIDQGITTDASDGGTATGFTLTVNTQGAGEDATNKKILISDATTPSQQVDDTARSLIRVINKQSDEIVNGFYLSGANDVPGIMLFEARNLGQSPFYIVANNSATGDEFNPAISPTNSITAISVDNPTEVTSTSHGLSTGNSIVISGTNSTPSIDGVYTVTVIDGNTFTVPVNVTVLGNTGGWILQSDAHVSDNEVAPNRVYYSKLQQPEAVPLVNYIDVGPRDQPILRIIALRDSLFILKSKGIYRLTGESTSNFSVALFDNSTDLLAADTAAVLNNQIYMFSTQGIATISDTGVSVISRPIENLITQLTEYTNFNTASHANGYESDRAYIVWTVTETTDSKATQAFRYNTFTQTWTDWDSAKTCSVVHPTEDKLYLGASDTNFIEVERKDFSRLDYADREWSKTILANGVDEDVLDLSSTSNINEGDVIVQNQYVTFGEFNRLLQKIDYDAAIPSINKTYYSTLQLVPGSNLRTQLDALASKLDSEGDTSGGYSALMTVATDFPTIQSEYNDLVTQLNADPLIAQSNFAESSGTQRWEMKIVDINSALGKVTLEFALNFIEGPVTIYNRIATSILWAPHYFEDPSMLKQVRETTVLFERNNFTDATLKFSTDLLPVYETQIFNGSGTGVFGNFYFGDTFFGGEGAGIPFRTYVPKNKQRCRYLNCKFEHNNAFEKYSILGISHTFEIHSTRAYRA